MSIIKTGSDFSGVGAFDQALKRLGIKYETIFACDWDKYARQTYIENYGEPKYFPKDVYERQIPKESLDIYMTSPPCQAFSLAGKRKGEDDERGILFYNSHEFIVKNNPRFFIFENVKGLLSDSNGTTFKVWLDLLGGKSVNGNKVLFPNENAVPYHIYWQVLNAKHYGVPQNRERVFIIGIRDDVDNTFRFPKTQHLTKRLKDVLEESVDDKYFLSEKMINGFINHKERHEQKGTGFKWKPKTKDDVANCLRANGALSATDNSIKLGYINQDTQASQVFSEDGTSPTLSSGSHGYSQGYVQVKSATKKGFEIATDQDSINFSVPNSKTRRGRVGKGVAQTLDTACNQGIFILGYTRDEKGKVIKRNKLNHANTIHTSTGGGGNTDQYVFIGASRGRGEENKQKLEKRKDNISNSITTVQKDNLVVKVNKIIYDKPLERKGWHNKAKEVLNTEGLSTCIHTQSNNLLQKITIPKSSEIRRLTPRECFRLMDFPEDFKWPVSDTQAYKQAGNSIVVNVLAEIINKLKL